MLAARVRSVITTTTTTVSVSRYRRGISSNVVNNLFKSNLASSSSSLSSTSLAPSSLPFIGNYSTTTVVAASANDGNNDASPSSSSSSSSSSEIPSHLRVRPLTHADNDASSTSPTASLHTNETPRSQVYMWGTSKKGTIPLELLDSKLDSSKSSSDSTLFSSGETIIDHPVPLNYNNHDHFRSLLSGSSSQQQHEQVQEEETEEMMAIEKVVCGATGTAMILSDGRCFVTGSNKHGELGIGSDKKEATQPTLLPIDEPVSTVSLGPHFSALITRGGDLYTFGYGGSRVNGMGCLGLGVNVDSHHTPTLVTSLIEDGCYAADVHVGEYSMTALTTEGEVLTCGSGSFGRLGNLETVDQLYLEPVELMGAEDVVQIAGGLAFSLALNRGGIVHAWGRNNEGQLGTGLGLSADMYAMESLPRPIEGDLEGRQVHRIAAGHTHAAAVTTSGELFTWGMHVTHEPKLESTLLHTKIVDVKCGQNYTLALDEEGRIYSMGKGKTGVLGLANVSKKTAFPILVEGIVGQKVKEMSCGWSHVACVMEG